MKRGKMMKKTVGRKAGAKKARSEMLQHDKKEERKGAKGYRTRIKDAAL